MSEIRAMQRYAVKGGDTLSSIAKRELGDALRWPEIYQANKPEMDMAYARAKPTLDRYFRNGHNIKHPSDLLNAGEVLNIPAPHPGV